MIKTVDFNKYYYVPFLVFFLLMIIIHWTLSTNTADDIFFKNIINNLSLFSFDGIDFLIGRYFSWSSRTLLELNLYILYSIPDFIWRILDSVAFSLIAYLTSLLIINQKLDGKNLFYYNSLSCIFTLIFFIAIYPILEVPGWIAGTLNYIWPLCFILIHFYLLKEYKFNNKNISRNKKILIDLLMIITLFEAVSLEQLLIVTVAIYFFILLYCFYNKLKIPRFIWLSLIILAFNLVYVYLSPGNHARFDYALEVNLPAFEGFTLFNNIDVGLTLFLNQITAHSNIIIYIFFAVVGIYSYLISNKSKKALINFIPLIVISALYFMRLGDSSLVAYVDGLYCYLGLFTLDFNRILTGCILYLSILLPILFSIVLIYKYKNNKMTYAITCLFILFLGSQAICGFTPSGTSADRLFIFSYFIAIIISFILCNDLISERFFNK